MISTRARVVRDVTEANRAIVRGFLEAHVETSLFLLSNLPESSGQSGHCDARQFRWIEEDGRIVAVFWVTHRGDLLAQTAGRADLAPEILSGCDDASANITGIVAEWSAAESLWNGLFAQRGVPPMYRARDVVYHLALGPDPVRDPSGGCVRALGEGDFESWDRLYTQFLQDEGLTAHVERERTHFSRRAEAGHWWGAFEGPTLVATAALNACYAGIGQIGGLYTSPEHRRHGYGKRIMLAVLRDARERHGLSRLVLFAAETNLRARTLYDALGFAVVGQFGFFFRHAP